MFLIITALAAIISTVLWYRNTSEDKNKLSILCFIYWGATLMWLVDHVVAFLEDGGPFFEVTPDATLLGITVVLSGLIAWAITLLLKKRIVFRNLPVLK